MPRSIGYTVAYSMAGETVDLCKIIIGGDGSYYITALALHHRADP